MRAEFADDVAGERLTFALPLGGLRKIAEHDPKLFILAQRLVERTATLGDIEAVLSASLADRDAPRRLIEGAGLLKATEYAARILFLAMTDEPGNGEAATA